MLILTQTAGARLNKLLEELPKNAVARIIRRDGRFRLRLDQERFGDITLAHEGRTVLALNLAVSEALSSRTLDVRIRNTGPRLSLTSTS